MTVASTFNSGAVRVMSLTLGDAGQLGHSCDCHNQGWTRTRSVTWGVAQDDLRPALLRPASAFHGGDISQHGLG